MAVSAGVSPAWAAMSKTVDELRPKIEPTIKELVDPLGKAKQEIRDKIKGNMYTALFFFIHISGAVMGTLEPLLETHVNTHIGKIVEIIKAPVVGSYGEAYKIFETN